MAISDLLIPVVVLPDLIAQLYNDGVWLVHGALGDIVCKLEHNSRILSSLVSVLSMMAIAADRFRPVVHPMRPPLFSHVKLLSLRLGLCQSRSRAKNSGGS